MAKGLLFLVFLIYFSGVTLGEEKPREIPYTLFARLPLIHQVSLSPNGENLAALYPHYGVTQLTIFDIRKNPENEPILLQANNDLINYISWANNDKLLINQENHFFVEDGKLMFFPGGLSVFDKNTQKQKPLVGGRGLIKAFYYKLLSLLYDDPDHILIEFWALGEEGTSVNKVNLDTGEREKVLEPMKNIFTWASDMEGVVRLGIGQKREKPIIVARKSAEDEWVEIQDQEIFEGDEFRLIGFSFDPTKFYFLSSYETGRDAVFEYDFIEEKITKKIWGHPKYDVKGLVLSTAQKRVEAGYYIGDFPEYFPLNEEFEKWQNKIRDALGGLRIEILSSTVDEQYYVIRSFSEKDPGMLYFFDNSANELSPIWEVLRSLFPENLNEVTKVTFRARDSLELEGYLTLPKGSSGKNLPTVILPHGGPWERDSMKFDAQTQFLANRGFATFTLNFRGSGGYGKVFRELGYGEWGGKMQTDIQDGLAWLIENEITDPEKVCIVGGSYGGYAALMALAQYPEDYRCAIAIAPVTDLNLLINEKKGDASEKLIERAVKNKMSKKQLKELSPFRLVDKIEDPILLFHGTKDNRVSFEHSEKLVKELKKKGNTYIFFPMENIGHDLFDEEMRFQYFREIENFLKTHLGDSEENSLHSLGDPNGN